MSFQQYLCSVAVTSPSISMVYFCLLWVSVGQWCTVLSATLRQALLTEVLIFPSEIVSK